MKRGTLYTFYSYKGGVGRSMALSNIAMLFYRMGFTVLVIDWDLEAPGIERYFAKPFNLDLDDIVDRPGLCCMLRQYVENAAKPAFDESDGLPYPRIEDYIYELDREGETQLLLMTAGRRTPGSAWDNYVEFVQFFDWTDFYQNWEGGRYLEWLREQFKMLADVVLIDSRTGVTEMGGVATQHLADAVLLFFGANLENITSTAKMAKRFLCDAVTKARGGSSLQIMVVPSRVDDADSEGYGTFLHHLEEAFADISQTGPTDGYDMVDVLIPYLAVCSYTEGIVIDNPHLERSAHRLAEAYRTIKSNMILMANPDSSLRSPTAVIAKADRIQVCIAHSRRDHDTAKRVQAYLARKGIVVIPIVTEQLSPKVSSDEIDGAIGRAICVVVLLSVGSKDSIRLRRIVQRALRVDKTVIPVVLEKDIPPSYDLVNIQHIYLQRARDKDLEQLESAIRVMSEGRFPEIRDNSKQILVYVSYSKENQRIAKRIEDFLSSKDLQAWMGAESVSPGADFTHETERALGAADVMIVLVSEAWKEDYWCQSELNYFINFKEKKPVVPLVVDRGTQVPLSLSSVQYIDAREGRDEMFAELERQLYKYTT